MGIGVFWLNAMMWALTQLVAESTMEEGFLEPALHPHRREIPCATFRSFSSLALVFLVRRLVPWIDSFVRL